MRIDERYLKSFGIFFKSLSENKKKVEISRIKLSGCPPHSIRCDVASNKFRTIPTIEMVYAAVFE